MGETVRLVIAFLVVAVPAAAAPKLKEKLPAWPDVMVGVEFPSSWFGPLRVHAIDKQADRVDLRFSDDTPYLVTEYKSIGYPVLQRRPTRIEVQRMIDQSRRSSK